MLGCWVTGRPKTTIEKLEFLASLGIKQFKLMPCGFKEVPRWKKHHITQFAEKCIQLDIEPALTVWPSFENEQINDYLINTVINPVIKSGFYGLEIELEMNANRICQEVAKKLIFQLKYITLKNNIWLGGTTHSGHIEATRNAKIMRRLEQFNIQAYSIRDRPSGTVESRSKLGPGKMQESAIKQADDCINYWKKGGKVSIGLAAWNQDWPDMTPQMGMLKAYRETLGYDCCYWSSAHILRNKYAQDFIRIISKRH